MISDGVSAGAAWKYSEREDKVAAGRALRLVVGTDSKKYSLDVGEDEQVYVQQRRLQKAIDFLYDVDLMTNGVGVRIENLPLVEVVGLLVSYKDAFKKSLSYSFLSNLAEKAPSFLRKGFEDKIKEAERLFN